MTMLAEHHFKVERRSPKVVMRLKRMGSFHQCRLSFMRTLLRRLKRDAWRFSCPTFSIDENGTGIAVYSATGPERTYSLVCFAHDLPNELRSDRVIAEAWDATFTLFDGTPNSDDIDRLSRNVPKQEAGRISQSELTLARANRSVRLFDHVVERLASGNQPDPEMVTDVGYLMRTTAVYGSGKFGAADRETLADRAEFSGAFQPEMLSVYLIRAFVLDLVEHLAKLRAPETAVTITPALRRRFGVGNSTGLGMAPFIVNHPVLLNNWINAREEALARVCSLSKATLQEQSTFRELVKRASKNVDEWRSAHPVQIQKLHDLKADMEMLDQHLSKGVLSREQPWSALCNWAEETLSVEGQEYLISLMLEPYGAIVDDLVETMGADETSAFAIQGGMSIERLKSILETTYDWALKTDWRNAACRARVWYVSEEKLEPRLGERFEEPVEPYEQPLAPGRDAANLYQDLREWNGNETVAEFLAQHVEHRHIVRRAQIADRFPYAEIRDNTIASDLMPIDLLRCKLSFFGATHFDPRSDRWVRINMFRDAPFPNELADVDEDNWSYPQLEEEIA